MSNTGRYYVKVGDRTFCVEPIDNTLGKGKEKWGDINPATKKVEGDYGNKHLGTIHEDDSIITKENGFKNIHMLGVGESPDAFIKQMIENETHD